MLSTVIPTLEAADSLADAIRCVAESEFETEIIVADGGSSDGTAAIAEALGARLIRCPPGRGGQLRAGAEAASGDWLLFLHADTVLAPGWQAAGRDFMNDAGTLERAAVFGFALDDAAPAARRLEKLVAWRSRFLALPFGDQGLLIGRAFYDKLGGYRPLPLYEDVDLVRRIGAKRLTVLDASAVTSAARYRRAGYVFRPLRNLTCLGLYFAGLPPRLIGRLYR
ncbi:MAG: TIGR04283 family arsenosugar biosynthesis glycosyltransferase [Rhodospirillales bacterium]|jgi:rSAM/selenodomain-associated transferase 2|nr:glycosyl transferase family 2 [Rhodospirillaceae bacterium]MDP6429256.1 TIGR04283 family arsenosugar biosynthesis glycosyltransferase [Rhodospirillales bacterium]MDP6643481.1 TIGR04283 family arsenosugar biosynthesis glycosyltransferase [Rhodospirillales bacterium]MDP6842871.1 TIGR04283 family arsenosugar biosynthesis glycosyltransferase [Rhodospirillales bacterium]